MSGQTKTTIPGHGDYERSDIGVAGIVYFLIGIAVAAIIINFVIAGMYKYLDKRMETHQARLSPIVKAPKDTRNLSTDYKSYLKQNFPSPQLELDERGQLNQILLEQEQTLATYGYVDQKAGTVRIPIERAIDLIVQRGMPTRGGNGTAAGKSAGQNERGSKQ